MEYCIQLSLQPILGGLEFSSIFPDSCAVTMLASLPPRQSVPMTTSIFSPKNAIRNHIPNQSKLLLFTKSTLAISHWAWRESRMLIKLGSSSASHQNCDCNSFGFFPQPRSTQTLGLLIASYCCSSSSRIRTPSPSHQVKSESFSTSPTFTPRQVGQPT